MVLNSRFHHNKANGISICWEVTHSRFEDNVIEYNGTSGISTGHGDSDTLFCATPYAATSGRAYCFANRILHLTAASSVRTSLRTMAWA